jgi:hypothetical protein
MTKTRHEWGYSCFEPRGHVCRNVHFCVFKLFKMGSLAFRKDVFFYGWNRAMSLGTEHRHWHIGTSQLGLLFLFHFCFLFGYIVTARFC